MNGFKPFFGSITENFSIFMYLFSVYKISFFLWNF